MFEHKTLLFAVCVGCGLSAGCVKMYTLPDAPPQSEWKQVEKPKASPEELMRRFLDAKRAAIQCFAALADSNWAGALAWMSPNTVAYFESHSGGSGAAAALDAGQIYVGDEIVTFDPVGDVFIRDLVDIRDEFAGREDDENETRMILYAVSSSGAARELKFVYENERWLLDSPAIKTELLHE
ncbi:MAG: hypothetical protein J6S69_03295 [Proteobacteria bacterium]|nr:hypothetical protein [Pseudomonadota bacterium]